MKDKDDAETRIRRVYATMAAPGRWASIREIREILGNIPRPQFDRAVLAMRSRGKVDLTLEENQSILTPEDRKAAIRLGPDAMHYMAIWD